MKRRIEIADNRTLGEVMIVLAVKSSGKKASVSVVEGVIENAFEVKIVNKLQRLRLEGWKW
jgi:hypothetical protein